MQTTTPQRSGALHASAKASDPERAARGLLGSLIRAFGGATHDDAVSAGIHAFLLLSGARPAWRVELCGDARDASIARFLSFLATNFGDRLGVLWGRRGRFGEGGEPLVYNRELVAQRGLRLHLEVYKATVLAGRGDLSAAAWEAQRHLLGFTSSAAPGRMDAVLSLVCHFERSLGRFPLEIIAFGCLGGRQAIDVAARQLSARVAAPARVLEGGDLIERFEIRIDPRDPVTAAA